MEDIYGNIKTKLVTDKRQNVYGIYIYLKVEAKLANFSDLQGAALPKILPFPLQNNKTFSY